MDSRSLIVMNEKSFSLGPDSRAVCTSSSFCGSRGDIAEVKQIRPLLFRRTPVTQISFTLSANSEQIYKPSWQSGHCMHVCWFGKVCFENFLQFQFFAFDSAVSLQVLSSCAQVKLSAFLRRLSPCRARQVSGNVN